MKNNFWFYLGLGMDVIVLLISLSNALMMHFASTIEGLNDEPNGGAMSGMTVYGRLMIWLIPLALFALMAVAFWLKSKGKMLLASILVWIPALPMLAGVVIWGGLAVIFILFGK